MSLLRSSSSVKASVSQRNFSSVVFGLQINDLTVHPTRASLSIQLILRPKWRKGTRELSAQIEALPTLNKAQLLAIWAENFSKDPPPNLRKELMVPVLAYRMQEREFGGLSHAARRRLREVAASLGTDKLSQERPDSAPQTGTRLLRVWRGETHEVIATEVDMSGNPAWVSAFPTITKIFYVRLA
jgi:hypothetical protein